MQSACRDYYYDRVGGDGGTTSPWDRQGRHPPWDTPPAGWKVHSQLEPRAQALLKCLLDAKGALGARSIEVHIAKVLRPVVSSGQSCTACVACCSWWRAASLCPCLERIVPVRAANVVADSAPCRSQSAQLAPAAGRSSKGG